MRKWPLLLCCWVNLVFRAYFWGIEALIRSYCFTVCFFLASNCTLKASPAVESMLSNVSLYFDIFLLNLTFILLLFQRGHIASPQSHPCCIFLHFFHSIASIAFVSFAFAILQKILAVDWLIEQNRTTEILMVNHQAPVALKNSIKKGVLCYGHIQWKGTPNRETGRFTADLHFSLSNPANLICQSHPQIWTRTSDEASVLFLSLLPVTYIDPPVYFLS